MATTDVKRLDWTVTNWKDGIPSQWQARRGDIRAAIDCLGQTKYKVTIVTNSNLYEEAGITHIADAKDWADRVSGHLSGQTLTANTVGRNLRDQIDRCHLDQRASRNAFTLVELLVVMFVLAILIALLLPAINGAVRSAKDATVTAEINMLATGQAAYKSMRGHYPPSKIALCETGDYSAATWLDLAPELAPFREESRRRLNAAFPRVVLSTIPLEEPLPVRGGGYDFDGDGKINPVPVLLTGDECLVFFLGGLPAPHAGGFGTQGFAKSQTQPFIGDSVELNRDKPLFEFQAGRLVDLDGDGFPSYVDPLGSGTGRRAYAYFSAYNGSGYDPDDCNLDGEPVGAFATYRGLVVSPGPNPYTSGPSLPVAEPYATGGLKPPPIPNSRWHKPDTYQIVSAGRDGVYGPGGWWVAEDVIEKLPYPAIGTVQAGGPAQPSTVRNDSEGDNLTNFAKGTLR